MHHAPPAVSSSLRISVALCTYNGADYLTAQLRSLAEQTLLPDELVVFDDQSTDHTAEIVAAFAERAPFQVRFQLQPNNVGVTQNFAAALAACQGDLIALCDQDDVWLPDKLAAARAFFDVRPRCLALFSDATLVDASLQPLNPNSSLWEQVGLTPRDRARLSDPAVGLETLAGRYLVTGATLVVRRGFLRHALPIPADLPRKLIHDGWFALVAAALGGLDSLPQSTLLYRQHANQQVGMRTESTLVVPGPDTRRIGYGQLALRLEHIHALLTTRLGPETGRAALRVLANKAAFFRRRAEPPDRFHRRLWPIAIDFVRGNYHHHCRRPLLAALRDLAF